jgi:hypothetical protein
MLQKACRMASSPELFGAIEGGDCFNYLFLNHITNYRELTEGMLKDQLCLSKAGEIRLFAIKKFNRL